MCNPLHAHYYADAAVLRQVAIVENRAVGRDTYRVRFLCPEIAQRVLPGQFLMVRLCGCDDPLIGRPLAVYDVLPGDDGAAAAIDLIYHVKGKFTRRLTQCTTGQPLTVWGPLGNGFPLLACDHLVMVAGGVGQTPFLLLAKEHLGLQRFGCPCRQAPLVQHITLCFGAQSVDLLAGADDFRRLGVDVRLATDDGSCGHHGLVTDLLEAVLVPATEPIQVATCGPVAMMRRTAEVAAQCGVPCQVSLETPMACGIGICFSCVAKVRDGEGNWDYKRTCVEGPVFDAASIEWS